MKLILALAVALAAAPPAQAQDQRSLSIQQKRTLTYPRPIGRIEVDRDDIISVAAPTARSLSVTGIGAGTTTISIFGRDGSLTQPLHDGA